MVHHKWQDLKITSFLTRKVIPTKSKEGIEIMYKHCIGLKLPNELGVCITTQKDTVPWIINNTGLEQAYKGVNKMNLTIRVLTDVEVEGSNIPKLEQIGVLNDIDDCCDIVHELETLIDVYNNEKGTDISTDDATLEIIEAEQDTTKDVDNEADIALIEYLKDDIYMLEGFEAAKFIEALLERLEDLSSFRMIRILLCLEDGLGDYDPIEDHVSGVPYLDDIEMYYVDSYKELAEELVAIGYYGEVPEALEDYINYEGMAEDLAHYYSEIDLLGKNVIYRLP